MRRSLRFKCLCSNSCCGHPSPSRALSPEASSTCYSRCRNNDACVDTVAGLVCMLLHQVTPNRCKSLESILAYPLAKDTRVTMGLSLLEITAEGETRRPRPSASLLGLSAGRQTVGKENFKNHRSPRCTINRATRVSGGVTGIWLRVPIESASGAVVR